MITIGSFELTDVNSFIVLNGHDFYLFGKYGDNLKCLLHTFAIYGKNGFSENKIEGDGKTPVGTFDFLYAFGINKKPETKLEYIRTDKNYCFVDDINSKYYNKLTDIRCDLKDWESCERITDYKREYQYAVNTSYNKECVKGKGSAIFLHCKGKKDYTGGCIAINKNDMLLCLKYLDKTSKIIIKKPD